ncbi:hypothetical protein [Streptomyces sp. NPDC002265]|uniref:hypothetical protein n=1 Tax=Streptomyces sp. NPDC002265 TaxID=3154415 RepID=UPI00331C121C
MARCFSAETARSPAGARYRARYRSAGSRPLVAPEDLHLFDLLRQDAADRQPDAEHPVVLPVQAPYG